MHLTPRSYMPVDVLTNVWEIKAINISERGAINKLTKGYYKYLDKDKIVFR